MKRIISIFCFCLLSVLNGGPSAARASAPDDGQFDGAVLLDLIALPEVGHPERAAQLLDYARRLQEARVKGLDKLRAALPEGADRRFVEDWLFFEQCRFIFSLRERDGKFLENGENRREIQKDLRARQDFMARLLQEKVDFLLEGLRKNPNLDTVLLQQPEDEPCVGDPCGHPTELFELRGYYESAQQDITDEKGREKLRTIFKNGVNGYGVYLYQRQDVEETLKALQEDRNSLPGDHPLFIIDDWNLRFGFIHGQPGETARAAAERLAVFTRDGHPKQRLNGLEMQFYSRYLQEFYEAKYYIGLYDYDGKVMNADLEKFPELLSQVPGFCTKHPEFLRPEIAKKCREAGRGGMK